jgi:L-fuculose-phosphate aldolase
MTPDERALRREIIEKCRWMNAVGLNQGTSGNISARFGDRMLITPSAVPYEEMEPGMIAAMPLDGEIGPGDYEGPLKPSTEWRFHRDILRGRPEAGAVVHTHAMYCTILAIARRPIPACHYMIAAFGGPDVRVADFHPYGTAELAAAVLRALDGRTGALMANHGMVTVGSSLAKAMWLAVELETIAKQYYHALLIGGPVILPDAVIADTLRGFASYGLQEPGRGTR